MSYDVVFWAKFHADMRADQESVFSDSELRLRAQQALPILHSLACGAKWSLDTGPHSRSLYGDQLTYERACRLLRRVIDRDDRTTGLEGYVNRDDVMCALRIAEGA
jgi:hypothetical protein